MFHDNPSGFPGHQPPPNRHNYPPPGPPPPHSAHGQNFGQYSEPVSFQNEQQAREWARNQIDHDRNLHDAFYEPYYEDQGPSSTHYQHDDRDDGGDRHRANRGQRGHGQSFGRERGKDRSKHRDRSRSRDRRRSRSRDRRRHRRHSSSSGSSASTRSRSRERRSRKHRERSHDRYENYDEYNTESLKNESWKSIPPNSTIMVSGLPLHATENDIRSDILMTGLVPKDIRLIRRKDTGTSRGFAFVEFNTLSEAVRWMDAKQGVLLLQDHYKATLQYSIPKDNFFERGLARGAQDWFCGRCGEHNFKRREVCFKCQVPRAEAEVTSDEQKEISPHPTHTILLRSLDILTTEESVLATLQTKPSIAALPIRSVRIGRDSLTSLSRGVCYLEMHSVVDAVRVYDELSAEALYIDDKSVDVSYCRVSGAVHNSNAPVAGVANVARTAVAAAQWSVSGSGNLPAGNPPELPTGTVTNAEDVARMAEYSASLYATNPTEHTAYLQYYQQYYLAQLPASAQAQEVKTPARKELAKKPLLGANGMPDISGFTYDEASGYYFDPHTGLYYDVQSTYFYDGHTQTFLYWDPVQQTFSPAPTQVTQGDASSAAAATVGGEAKDDSKKGKEPKKDEKVNVAKKIQKDMEKWAKTLNQRKEVVRQPTVAQASSSASADAGFNILEKKETKSSLQEVLQVFQQKSFAEKMGVKTKPGLVAAYGGDSESDDDEEKRQSSNKNVSSVTGANTTPSSSTTGPSMDTLTDWIRLACLLCKRQFGSKEALVKHQQLSDLHKQNLEQWKKSQSQADNAAYRDRAKERRAKYGEADDPAPRPPKENYPRKEEKTSYEEPVKPGIGDGNVGNKLLQKMGWQQGMGLGKSNQGRTEIIEAEGRRTTAGLGTSTYGPAPGDSYRDSVKKMTLLRYKELD